MRVRQAKHRETTRPGHSGRRRGVVVAELILVMPILMGFLFGTIEFSMLLSAREQLLLASREGARVGARGGSDAEINTAVQNVLASGPVGSGDVVVTRTAAAPPNT